MKQQTTGRRRFRLKKWHIIVASILAVLVLINMAIIFMLSEESKDESGERSTGVVAFFLNFLFPDYDDFPYDDKMLLMSMMGHIVRKAAHFSEYALLGFLFTGFLCFIRRHIKKMRSMKYWVTWVVPPVFCLLYAISDEVHQIFSNRGPSAKDVLIDFCGAITGILLMHLILSLRRIYKMSLTESLEKETSCESPDTN